MSADSATVTISHHASGLGGRYIAKVADTEVEGYLEWETGGAVNGQPVRIAAHTVVPPEIGGRGVAGQLVDQLVEDAQRLGFLIRPDCSYVAAKFADNPDWASLKA